MTQLSSLFQAGAGEKWELFHIQDQKTPGTQGGSLTLGSWQTRILNTVLKNEIGGASLASNQLTLPAGEYEMTAKAVAYSVNRNKLRIQNITDASLIAESLNEEITASVSGMDTTVAFASFSLSSPKVIELQHRSESTQANGLGFQINSAFAVNKEIYCDVQIRRKVSSITLPFQSPLLHVEDQKSSGTNSGTFTSGAWLTRTVNTVVTNEIDNASLSSNQITLPAGKYYIEASAPGYAVDQHKIKLYNVTDASDTLIGTGSRAGSTTPWVESRGVVTGIFTLSGTKTFELRHRCLTTVNNNGFGIAISAGVIEIYAVVKIWKLD